MTAQQIGFDLPPARATAEKPPPFLWVQRIKGDSLPVTLAAARARYREKFGREATLCCVNHADLPELVGVVSIDVRPLSTVNVGSLFVGVDGS